MDPLMRKLFQPREAREKLRGMGGIMSSSPQLASTVAKFQQGGPIQSRGLALPSAPDAPLPSAGRARATRVGDRTFVLTDDGRVLDAQTGAPASPEVEAEVRSRLSPQLSMMDIVGGVSQIDPTGGGVNPAFREDTSGQLPPMPSDVGPMSVPADPGAPFDMDAFQRDLTGAGRAVAGPGLMAIDELSYDGPFFATANDTSAAEAAIDRRMNADAVIDAPADGTSFADALSRRPRMAASLGQPTQVVDEFTMMPYGDVGNESVPELAPRPDRPAPVIDEFMPYGNVGNESVPDLINRPSPVGTMTPAAETGPVESPVPDAETPDADTTPPAPTLDVDLDDPDTYDTNFEEMMRRLGGATGKDDKSSRQKAMADLAMIGLAIAAGQSPDALTNIAQGALTGMKAVRAEDAATSAADRETRMLAARLATEQSSRDKQIASNERIAGINLAGRGSTYGELLLQQIEAITKAEITTDPVQIQEQAKGNLAAAGIYPPAAPAAPAAQITEADRQKIIRERVKAAQNDPVALKALEESLKRQGRSISDYKD